MQRAGLLVFVALALAGCVHVPFSTLWQMRGFSPERFAALDPAGLTAAVRLPDAAGLGRTGHMLTMTLSPEGAPGTEVAAPMEVSLSLREAPGLAGEPGAHWHALTLTPEGVSALRRMQAALREVPRGARASFEISVTPSFQPDEAFRADLVAGRRAGRLSVAVRFQPDSDWLVLLDGAPIRVPNQAAAR